MSLRDFLLIIGMAVVAGLGMYLIIPDQNELNQKRRRLNELTAELQELESELLALQKENAELKRGNPYSLIRAARETYNYCLPGEKVYHFPPAFDRLGAEQR